MNTIKITKADLNEKNEYKKGNIGTWNNYEDTHVEIEANLGWVKFTGMYVKGRILAQAGSGIEAGWGIKAGEGLEAGWGIKAGEGIKAGWGIEAGSGIKAGSGIEAGSGIKAGEGIKAGWGIVSFYSCVIAKLRIESNLNCTISAGIFSTTGKKEISAQEVIGNVIYGDVKLIPIEKEEELEELTMDEICKLLGKTIKIKK